MEVYDLFELEFCLLLLLRYLLACSIPSAGMHWRTGEQISGTVHPCDFASGEGESGFWVALCATAQGLHHGSFSIQVGCCGVPSSAPPVDALCYKDRLHPNCDVRLHGAPAQYVFRDQIQFIIIFSDIMFMMFVLSSMLEYCMLDFIFAMFNLVRSLNL